MSYEIIQFINFFLAHFVMLRLTAISIEEIAIPIALSLRKIIAQLTRPLIKAAINSAMEQNHCYTAYAAVAFSPAYHCAFSLPFSLLKNCSTLYAQATD